MNWAVKLSASAIKELNKISREQQSRIVDAIDAMENNPFAGDVKQLKGKDWQDHYRKRVGSYRIIFSIDQAAMIVAISRILIRSEKTYR